MPTVVRQSTPASPSQRLSPYREIEILPSATGRYSHQAIPVGPYYVCASPGEKDHLSTCSWSRRPAVAEIKEKLTSEVSPLILRKGALLTIRVRNGKALLPKTETSRIGIRSSQGAYQPAMVVNSAGPDQDFEILVPRDEQLSLYVSDPVKVNDLTGAAIRNNASSSPLSFGSDRAKIIEIVARQP